MSISKANKALKSLLPLAAELKKIALAEGERSDREHKRARELASEIIGTWAAVTDNADSIERMAEEGPRTEAEEMTLKAILKSLKKLGGALWKSRDLEDFVLSKPSVKQLKRIRGQIARWKRALKKAPKRTASAATGEGEGQDKTQGKEREQTQEPKQAMA